MRGRRWRGRTVAAAATLATLAAGCGGGDGAETATTPAVRQPQDERTGSGTVTPLQTGGPRRATEVRRPGGTAAPRAASGRSLAGDLDAQERALAILPEEADLPAGWRPLGTAMSGLGTIDRARRGARRLDLSCFAGDRPRTVAALARTPTFVRRSSRIDADAIVYVGADDGHGAIAFLRGAAFRRCLGATLRAELTPGGRGRGVVRGSLADAAPSDDGAARTGLRFALGGEDGRGAKVADVVAVAVGPALAILHMSSADAGDAALRERLTKLVEERLQASYG